MRSPHSFQDRQGFFTFAQNTAEIDYLDLAYLQACSVKKTQRTNKFAVAVDASTEKLITSTHRKVFDYIIQIPKADAWAMNNEWLAWHLTPFKETIKLESDILFTQNIDHWWTGLRHQEICFTNQVRNYRGQVSTSREYRKLFDDNDLPDIYTGIYYFRFGKHSMDFFRLVEQIYKNWSLFRNDILKNCREELPSTDVVFAVAAQIAGAESCTVPALDYPSFVHMKGAINGLSPAQDWRSTFPYDLNGTALTINFTKQLWPVHYYQKDFFNERNRIELTESV